MRTAHLIVSGAAFAVWLAAVVVYCVMCDNSTTDHWWLYGPGAVLPSFWCVYAWFASRRAVGKTSWGFMVLALPVLCGGLAVAILVVSDVTHSVDVGERRAGMATGMVGPCCWEPAALCGLASFVWAVVLQVKGLSRPTKESEANPDTEARP